MKPPYQKAESFENRNEMNGSNSTRKIQNKSKMKKNIIRMGGGGLSLETFANAKSRNNAYNPAIIKKQREFYKTAKCVNKYKQTLKQKRPGDISLNVRLQEDNIENGETSGVGTNKKHSKNKKMSAYSLKQLYEEKHEEQEKARKEREELFQTKKEEREKADSKRKAIKKKMFKKTKSGQPVMRYRIEHLLETIQASANH